jgi:hypothetical protein
MYVVLALLEWDPSIHDPAALRDALLASAFPPDGLFHVFARSVAGGAEAALFVRARSPGAAVRAGTDLCQRACAQYLSGAVLRCCEAAAAGC